MAKKPSTEDAKIIMQLYDLRREAEMRRWGGEKSGPAVALAEDFFQQFLDQVHAADEYPRSHACDQQACDRQAGKRHARGRAACSEVTRDQHAGSFDRRLNFTRGRIEQPKAASVWGAYACTPEAATTALIQTS